MLELEAETGRDVDLPDTPRLGMVFSPRAEDRWTETTAWKPVDVANALRQAEDGDLSAQAHLFEYMEETDMVISGLMQTRRNALLGLDYRILPANDSDEAKRARDMCEREIQNLQDWEIALIEFLDAIGKSISISEILYQREGYTIHLAGFRHVSPKRYRYDRQKDELRVSVANFSYPGTTLSSAVPPTPDQTVALAPGKFVVHRSKMRAGHAVRGGALRVMSLGYVIRQYNLKDWSVYNELFGMPIRVGKYPDGAVDSEKAKLLSAVRMLGSDGAAIISKSTEIELVESIGRGDAPYENLRSAIEREMAICAVGQELTNTVSKTGTRAQAQIQQMVRQDLLEADCRQIQSTIRRDIFRPLVHWNIGAEAAKNAVPIFKLRYEPLPDLYRQIDVDVKLFGHPNYGGLGLPVTKAQLYERYGWEPPPDDTKPEDFLFPELAAPEGNGADRTSQTGENHDDRPSEDRRVAFTRGGSMAADVAKSLQKDMTPDQLQRLAEILMG
jgi:phage gp29-like protein